MKKKINPKLWILGLFTIVLTTFGGCEAKIGFPIDTQLGNSIFEADMLILLLDAIIVFGFIWKYSHKINFKENQHAHTIIL